jgi:hypothetical protein
VTLGEGRPEHSVAMWGAPTSGKTTFLAALSIALARQEQDWKVIGADEASTETLIRLTTALARDRRFPQATSGIERYRWILVGRVSRAIPRRWFRAEQREEPIKIGLDLVDASGEISAPDKPSRGVRGDLIDNLERSRGIVFLFDPIREFNKGDAFDYTFGVLAQLAQRMVDSPEYSDGYLPHHVAVCVTKFDEIRVFRTAEKLDLLVSDSGDPYGFPRVDDSDARELFARLCEVSHSGNAELVLSTLEKHFRPDRIRYFVTSAIGFHVDSRNGAYNPDDYQNLVPDPDEPESTRIRGSVHPINVVEPLLWLARKLGAEQEPRE